MHIYDKDVNIYLLRCIGLEVKIGFPGHPSHSECLATRANTTLLGVTTGVAVVHTKIIQFGSLFFFYEHLFLDVSHVY